MVKAKYVLLGAATQLVPKTVSHFTFNYMTLVQKVPGEELRKTFWYMEPFGAALPPVDDWICDIGIPAGLLLASLFVKRYKEPLQGMAFGAALTGGATFLHDVLMRSSAWLTP
jgi:hypothetical protein